MGTLRVMSHAEGDVSTVFDPKDEASIKIAMEKFDEAMKPGSYAYRKGQDGKPNEAIKTFDPTAEEMVVRPMLAGG